MSDKSSIEWTDATWNPTRGCTKIAQGCKNCYAETFAERWRGVQGHAYEQGFDPRTAPDQLTLPLRWKKSRRIFVDSMSDLFHEAFPFEYIAAVFGVMAACPQHTFQVLTKRPERAVEFFTLVKRQHCDDGNMSMAPVTVCVEERGQNLTGPLTGDEILTVLRAHWPLPNVWIGTSIAEQKDADANIPHLLQIPAAVRFLSCEPLIGPIEFSNVTKRSDTVTQLGKKALNGIGWVIAGGESGPGARPCNVEWIRSIVAQCKAAEVPVFVKQLGAQPVVRHHGWTDHDEPYVVGWPDDVRFGSINGRDARPLLRDRKGGDWEEWPEDLRVRQFPSPLGMTEEAGR